MNQRDKNYDKNVILLTAMACIFFGGIWSAHLYTEKQSAKEEALYDQPTLGKIEKVKAAPKVNNPTEAKREELRVLAQSMRAESLRRKQITEAEAAEDARELRKLKSRLNRQIMEDTRSIRKVLGTQTLNDRFYEMIESY
jgi:hypothetical protein